jgi:L-threonylcarbamoyladenylate synthase
MGAPRWAGRGEYGPHARDVPVRPSTTRTLPAPPVRSEPTVMSPAPPVLQPDDEGLSTAGAALREGRLVAVPTETVYGLGAHAFDPAAIARVFAAKGRPADNPLIVHLADADELSRVVSAVTPLARALAARFWPGPLTIVLTGDERMPKVTTGGLDTIAIRVPDHPVATALLRAADVPVAAPSANRSGRPSPTTAAHVVAELGDEVDLIVDGGTCAFGLESTVVDARGPRAVILREGAVTRESLADLLDGGGAPVDQRVSPGTRYRHYAPDCRLEVLPARHAAERAEALAGDGQRVGYVGRRPPPAGVVGILRFESPVELAQQLYAALRAAEDASVEVLVVEAVEEAGIGRAVMDRLRRASA